MIKKFWMAILTILCSIGITIAVSYAWFLHDENVDPIAQGYSGSAYFAYGDGVNTAYGINTPRHLYNLAWLCYLFPSQYASKKYEIDPSLNGNLNMSGWVLPPIGTDSNPFIGYFNGNGKTIKNLTTSNNFNDFNDSPKPSTVNAIQNCGNMGFFGNIGPTTGTAAESNVVGNFYLDNNIVKTGTSTSGKYFGAVAGYVNATLQDVGVISATLNNASATTISEYSVVGYATENYLTALNNKSTIIYNPTTTNTNKYTYQGKGTATGWGGSIDMLSLYNDGLLGKWTSSYSNSNFITYAQTKNVVVDKNGNETITYSDYSHERMYLGSDLGYHDLTYESSYVNDDTSDKKIASYSFFYRESTSQFLYLAGNQTRTVSNAVSSTISYPDAKYISDGNGNYLTSSNNSTVSNATYNGNPSKWYFNDDLLYKLAGTTKYYLNDDNGVLVISQTAYTNWEFSQNTYVSDSGNYLIYDDGWILSNSNYTSITKYKISSGTHYFSYDEDNEELIDTNEANATEWMVDLNSNIYLMIDGTKYYLNGSNNRARYLVLSDVMSSYSFKKNNNQIRMVGRYSNYYYLTYNTEWTANNNTNATNLTITQLTITDTFNLAVDNVPNEVMTEDAVYTTDKMYVPLAFGTDVNGNDGVSRKNTGYLVGGSYRGGTQPSDIRVSKYSISSINNSYTNSSGLGTIYTINDSGTSVTINNTVISNMGWTKYNNSKTSLATILASDSSWVYGLHFMESTIDINHIITADWASVNGSDYIANYQLPEDSIDFNLREKGKVNFFAGTYFSGNNSFFSYNEIQRNNGTIVAIKQISEILSDGNNSHSYVYKYSDNKYSVPYVIETVNGVKVKKSLSGEPYEEYSTQNSVPSGYSTIFKTSWIGKQNSSYTTNRIYYFEVPTNDGEYALGSVSGGKGAYLLYLDIGANATEVYRTEITQKTTITTSTYKYPTGVSIVPDASSDVDPRNYGVATINSTGTHAISISTENQSTTITITGATTPSYVNPDVVLSNGSNALNYTGTSPTTTTISQLMIVDYVKSDSISTYVTLITDETGKNRTSEYYLLEGNGVLDGWGLFTTPTNELDAIVYTEDNADFSINVTNSSTQKEKHYYYSNSSAETSTAIKMLVNNGTEQDEGKYYGCSGDNIYITTDETIKVYVTQKDNLIYNFFFNLDLDDYPYPSNQQDVPSQVIASGDNYEYEVTTP